MNVAPALAASSAWFGEKHNVTLVGVPSLDKMLHAFKPSIVSGNLTQTLGEWMVRHGDDDKVYPLCTKSKLWSEKNDTQKFLKERGKQILKIF